MNSILRCNGCGLRKNQRPLIDNNVSSAEIFWVGLSAKKVQDINDDIPLGPNTNTGKILHLIESEFENRTFYKTNLVKCLPLNEKMKLRYPTKSEMLNCKNNIDTEIAHYKPRLIFLLGNTVFNAFYDSGSKVVEHRRENSQFTYKIMEKSHVTTIGIPHPSYIHIYKRKYVKEYVNDIAELIVCNF